MTPPPLLRRQRLTREANTSHQDAPFPSIPPATRWSGGSGRRLGLTTRLNIALRSSAKAALLCSMLVSTGCKGFEHDAHCRELAGAVNATLQDVAALDSQGPHAAPANSYIDIAQHYRDLERRLAKLEEPMTDELAQASAGVRAVLRVAAEQSDRYAELIRELNSAGQAEDKPALERAQRGLKSAHRRMEKNVTAYATARQRVERLCVIR